MLQAAGKSHCTSSAGYRDPFQGLRGGRASITGGLDKDELQSLAVSGWSLRSSDLEAAQEQSTHMEWLHAAALLGSETQQSSVRF